MCSSSPKPTQSLHIDYCCTILTIFHFVGVEHGQQLPVEGHQRRSDQIRGHHQLLDDPQRDTHDLDVACIERIYTEQAK